MWFFNTIQKMPKNASPSPPPKKKQNPIAENLIPLYLSFFAVFLLEIWFYNASLFYTTFALETIKCVYIILFIYRKKKLINYFSEPSQFSSRIKHIWNLTVKKEKSKKGWEGELRQGKVRWSKVNKDKSL